MSKSGFLGITLNCENQQPPNMTGHTIKNTLVNNIQFARILSNQTIRNTMPMINIDTAKLNSILFRIYLFVSPFIFY